MQLNSVLESLNLSDKDGLLFYSDINSTNFNFSNRLKESILKIKPDAIFCINNEPLILFFENPSNLEEIEKQVWNFNQSPAVFISNGNEWIIKNGFKYLKEEKELDLLSNDISEFDYFKIITGTTWQNYQEQFENKNRVDYFLLQNIENARDILINDLGLHYKVANSLIGRVIFIRYLIDRKVELNKYNILKKEDFYKILSDNNTAYNFFKEIRDDFNGNLFPLEYFIDGTITEESSRVNSYHLDLIISLLKGDKLNKHAIQISLFDIYDFSIIPIEFISNVYEKFIGLENQAEQGAYYTPLFLVDYIQSQTVAKYFRTNTQEYNCKVLDPACGSGIFLVETLRQIVGQYQKLNPDFNLNDENYKIYRELLKKLLTDNIYGVDKDESAISVAIFSLYITLLDYLTPRTIVGFEFPLLIDKNFFIDDFFNNVLDEKIGNQHFQFILGNPPWATKHLRSKQLFEEYVEERRKRENSNLEIIHREIAEAFLIRVSDFNFTETAFIVTSKILYKLEKKGLFRNYFLSTFKVRQVLELSSVRHQIFDKSNDKAVAPATVLFYSKSNSIEESRSNLITHISLKPNVFFEIFKLLVIEKYDFKEVAQSFFIDEDWIWKVMVYGNVLDYYLIKRLKTEFSSIDKITSDSKKFKKGQGLKFNDGKKQVATQAYKDYKFLGSLEKKVNGKGELKDAHTNYKKYLRPYYSKKDLTEWDGRDVGYFPEDVTIFQSPVLVITGGTTKEFKSVSAIIYSNVLFKSSLTAIKAVEQNDVQKLRAISALLNSSFFSFFILLNGSSTGIEREETHDEEKWGTPFVYSDELANLVFNLEQCFDISYTSLLPDVELERTIEKKEKEVENEIFKLLNLSEQERSLVDYTNTVSIPLLKGKEIEKKRIIKQIDYKDPHLENYANIFIKHFKNRFNKENKFFEVEIIFSNHSILMLFKIVNTPTDSSNPILWQNKSDKELLTTISKLSFENLSNNLYLQKDIKGFEDNFFYVAKINQFKSWHSALAYLDLSEFIDALHGSKLK